MVWSNGNVTDFLWKSDTYLMGYIQNCIFQSELHKELGYATENANKPKSNADELDLLESRRLPMYELRA
jgi:hypothetical protein